MRTILNRLTHHMRNPYASHALTLTELAHHMRKGLAISAPHALVRAIFGRGVTHHMRSSTDMPCAPRFCYWALYMLHRASGIAFGIAR